MKKQWKIGTKDSFQKDINGNITSEIINPAYAKLLEHNPQSQEENIPTGEIITTISGKPRKMMSTIPAKTISVSGENIKQSMKEFLEMLQAVNTNLILVISTLYGDEKIYEVIPVNLKTTRRKTIPFETEPSYSYNYEMQVVKRWA